MVFKTLNKTHFAAGVLWYCPSKTIVPRNSKKSWREQWSLSSEVNVL